MYYIYHVLNVCSLLVCLTLLVFFKSMSQRTTKLTVQVCIVLHYLTCHLISSNKNVCHFVVQSAISSSVVRDSDVIAHVSCTGFVEFVVSAGQHHYYAGFFYAAI